MQAFRLGMRVYTTRTTRVVGATVVGVRYKRVRRLLACDSTRQPRYYVLADDKGRLLGRQPYRVYADATMAATELYDA